MFFLLIYYYNIFDSENREPQAYSLAEVLSLPIVYSIGFWQKLQGVLRKGYNLFINIVVLTVFMQDFDFKNSFFEQKTPI